MAGISVIAQSSNNYNNEWQLIWQDEFNEETLNEAKWSKIPRGKSEVSFVVLIVELYSFEQCF